MQIPINKNSLASALPALGKLVSRTSLIKAYQGIEIEGKANMLYFRTRNVIEQIEFRLFADLEDDFPAILVEFEQFRQMVRSCKNKTMKLEIDCGEVFIDDVKLAPIKGHFPLKETIPDQDKMKLFDVMSKMDFIPESPQMILPSHQRLFACSKIQ